MYTSTRIHSAVQTACSDSSNEDLSQLALRFIKVLRSEDNQLFTRLLITDASTSTLLVR